MIFYIQAKSKVTTVSQTTMLVMTSSDPLKEFPLDTCPPLAKQP